MQGLANFTVAMYVVAFVLVLAGIVAWWARRPRKNKIPGEPPARYVDDSKDRIA